MVIVNTELMKKIQEMPIDVLCNFGNLIWISTNISLDDLYVEIYKKCLSNRMILNHLPNKAMTYKLPITRASLNSYGRVEVALHWEDKS